MSPARQNTIQRTVKSVHTVCALHCAQLLHITILRRTDLIIFPLNPQPISIAPMMSTVCAWCCDCSWWEWRSRWLSAVPSEPTRLADWHVYTCRPSV